MYAAPLLLSEVVLNSEAEIALCIVVANVADHTLDAGHLGAGDKAAVHVGTYEIAQHPAEIFVAWIGQEGSRIGEHAHEAAQKSLSRECVHLVGHAADVVVEPPARAHLHFSRA